MSEYKELKGGNQVLFALGHIGPGMLNQFITTWLLVYLSGENKLLLSASLTGVCLMCGRLVDALADPLVANWSDRMAGSRFGRRLPFIIGGAIPMVLSFNMLWHTQILNSTVARFIWVVVAVNLFYFSYTVVVNPYFALMPEIARDKKQRTFIQSFVAFFGILGMGIAMGASGFIIDAIGYSGAGLALSLLCAATLIGPALTVKIQGEGRSSATEKSSSNIFISLKSALSNKTFRTYISGFCIFFLGFQMIQYNLAFITTVLLGLDRGMSSTLFITSVVCGILFIPVYNIILKRTSCSSALKLAIVAYVVAALLIAAIPLLTGIGLNGQILGYILMAFLGFPYSGLMVIPNVIIGEIIDEDVKKNNIRREALFFGVQGLINKFMVSIAALSVGFLQDFLGNNAAKPWGIISVAPIAALVALAGFFVIGRLHISGGGTE
jgi:GPH family glycoside/pentoside/hexuronide:cation symporter